MTIHVAILAGGRGTRFWPLSRHAVPKQLLDVLGEGPMALRTLERVRSLARPGRTTVITSEDLAPALQSLLGLKARDVVAEPAGRGTAGAVGLACVVAAARDPEAVVLALPADHHVGEPAKLVKALERAALAAAAWQAPVLLGITPDSPSTHMGYIERGAPARVPGVRGLIEVARFTEKPPEPKAMALISKGALWNSGMFCVPARATLEAMTRLIPRLGAALRRLHAHVDRPTWGPALRREWKSVETISFDHGVLERLHPVLALPADVGWSDVGTWDSLASLIPADAKGNRSRGPAYLHASSHCLVVNQPGSARTVVVAGAEDLLVVDTGDVVLVAPKSVARDPKALLAALAKHRPELL